jgi:hypothetical protein
MKFNKGYQTLLFTALSAFVITFSSCEKTTDEVVENITPSASASISGQPWTTKIAAGVNSTIFVITASKDKEAIVLSLQAKEEGTFSIDGISTNASYVPVIDSIASAYIAYSGTVVVKDLNFARTQFNGTFEFDAVNSSLDTIHVTNGILTNIPTK